MSLITGSSLVCGVVVVVSAVAVPSGALPAAPGLLLPFFGAVSCFATNIYWLEHSEVVLSRMENYPDRYRGIGTKQANISGLNSRVRVIPLLSILLRVCPPSSTFVRMPRSQESSNIAIRSTNPNGCRSVYFVIITIAVPDPACDSPHAACKQRHQRAFRAIFCRYS